MHKEYVIIGGGAAGLSAAVRLAEFGQEPLVIEGGKYPSHKVCGEFFSPDCVSLLKRWNIFPIEIDRVHFRTSTQSFGFTFPENAGSMSHMSFDPQLVERLLNFGGSILTEAKVNQLIPIASGYEIKLDSGAIINASNLIIATGRIPSFTQSIMQFPYIGIKAHFEGLKAKKVLEMFVWEDGYVGISPIENEKFNVAALVRAAGVSGTPNDFMDRLILTNPFLSDIFSSAKPCFEWMSTPIPCFGSRKTPSWPNVYFIGDAAGTIPPVTGNGLGMSVKGGIMAAEFAIHKNWEGFRIAWKDLFASPIRWGKLLHRAALNPLMCNSLIKICNKSPSIASYLYKTTRKKGKLK